MNKINACYNTLALDCNILANMRDKLNIVFSRDDICMYTTCRGTFATSRVYKGLVVKWNSHLKEWIFFERLKRTDS